MAKRPNPKIDEHDVEFNDTRSFALERWADATNEVLESHTRADRATILEHRDWQTLADSIKEKAADPRNTTRTKSYLNYLKQFPSTLKPLVYHFIESVPGREIQFLVLWGSIELNTRLARTSPEKSARTLKWTKKLRGVLEVFNKCLDSCEEVDKNEARVKIVDVLEAILRTHNDSIIHLRSCPTDTKATEEWPDVDKQIQEYILEVETAGKHLSDMTSLSKLNQQRQLRDLAYRHIPVPTPEENVAFPVVWLNNRGRNEEFFGRTSEIKKIDNALSHIDNTALQTYTIYGRRGVGKTDIALEYAYRNTVGFDAIFWIRCETAIAIRQSYNDVAVELGLPGADRHGQHEENQLAVLRWLKTTHRRWLLIFDNAESEDILQGYWPLGAKGSILITSRTYYNFLRDSQRKGDTVKPFNEADSWQLLMKLLGPKWVDDDKNDQITQSEENAGRKLLRDVGGLALAVRNIAGLIKNSEVGGGTIEKVYRAFLDEKADLPDRLGIPRSEIVKSLDSLWNITFRPLTRSARSLLSIIALLSPDGIPIDLFLPRNQRALDGKLAFCKQDTTEIINDRAFLADVIEVPHRLQNAIDELVRLRLITKEGREIFAHRVVQEAMNYHSAKDLQDCIDSAAALVYEAFPKQVNGDYMASQWARCHDYISHGAHLSRLFARLRGGNKDLVGSDAFVRLLCNCARYLYEVGDYDFCVKVCETARLALVDEDSILHADICSSAGSALYELNRLDDCRKEWERFFRIQKEKLWDRELERSASYNNMGNLEYAAGNQVEAKRYLDRAIAIRQTAGDDAAGLLATSYLCISRVYYADRDYKTAFHMVGKAESLFVRTIGAAAHFMAYVHYAYGNIYYMQDEWAEAKTSYDKSLKIALATAAVHPITVAVYYSLGCVEFARNGQQFTPIAKTFLDKALTIAQLRSPQRDDGTITRIIWKLSVVLNTHMRNDFQEQADDYAQRAEKAKVLLNSSGEGKVFGGEDDEYVVLDDNDEEESSYDALVPGFFR